MRTLLVDFVVEGIDDEGRPSGMLLQATEVALVDDSGRELGRFTEASSLKRTLMRPSRRSKLIAVETVGVPRRDLTGLFCCDEQAWCEPRYSGPDT